ncbi:MAG: nicotinate phosphoribosyltransferase [Deltaproteobacteria bacterium]|nr:nicotinate phosphoribosyltransferase [Deltaproteobacteria bacterium]
MTGPQTALLTDFYQLTMAQGYWHTGLREREVCFDYFFRSNPFGGGYTVTAGLPDALAFLRDFAFTDEDLAHLDTLDVFGGKFLEYLGKLRFRGEVHAAAEGTVAFPMEPVLRVTGKLDECQLVESALLNILNFQSLVATKACRIYREAGGDVMEFGLRRAQGVDGAITASRAAFVGGCASTSNVEAGRLHGIPVAGTLAHSWVMAYEDEETALRRYAAIYGSSSVLLVDTYDTLGTGLPAAIAVARELEGRGKKLAGIRLDSGDLAKLSREARAMLDAEGLEDVKIVCSGDLDEHAIRDLKQRGARIDGWGVGTRLVTAGGDPALAGVYKLAAVRTKDGQWEPRSKTSDEPHKATLPGVKQVWRLSGPDGGMVADLIALESEDPDPGSILGTRVSGKGGMELIRGVHAVTPLLEPVMKGGKILGESEDLMTVRERVQMQVGRLPGPVSRIDEPEEHLMLVGPDLLDLTQRLRVTHS